MFTAAVLTVSDRSFRGERPDGSGPLVASLLEAAGYRVAEAAIVPDEQEEIQTALIVNLPGSLKAARENLEAVLPALGHGQEMLRGGPADCGRSWADGQSRSWLRWLPRSAAR